MNGNLEIKAQTLSYFVLKMRGSSSQKLGSVTETSRLELLGSAILEWGSLVLLGCERLDTYLRLNISPKCPRIAVSLGFR